jgi:hypothetical protein
VHRVVAEIAWAIIEQITIVVTHVQTGWSWTNKRSRNRVVDIDPSDGAINAWVDGQIAPTGRGQFENLRVA